MELFGHGDAPPEDRCRGCRRTTLALVAMLLVVALVAVALHDISPMRDAVAWAFGTLAGEMGLPAVRDALLSKTQAK